MAGGGDPFNPWNFGSTGPRGSEIADFEPIFARSASAVTPNEKRSINANRKTTTRFPVSLSDHRTLPLTSPKGAQKGKPADFRLKSRSPNGGSKTQSVRNLNNKLR